MKTTSLTFSVLGILMFTAGRTASADMPELDPNLERVLNSVKTLEGTPSVDPDNISNNEPNVQRVMKLVSEDDFYNMFPMANATYDYTDFLMAVAKFPAFCNEAVDMSQIEQVCANELRGPAIPLKSQPKSELPLLDGAAMRNGQGSPNLISRSPEKGKSFFL